MTKNATLKCIAAGGALSLLAFCPLVARAQTPPASPAAVSQSDTARQKAAASEIFPRDHWVYAELIAMEKRGVPLYGAERHIKETKTLTRFQLAVVTARLGDLILTTRTGQDRKDSVGFVNRIGFDLLIRLTNEVETELRGLGVDVAKMKADLATFGPPTARQTPFTDTPPQGHWARESVEKVRAAGVLVGYEDGSLNGNRR